MITAKRMKIRVPQRIKVTEESFQESWVIIQDAIDKIYDDSSRQVSFENVYRTVYNLVLGGEAQMLHKKLREYLTSKNETLYNENFGNESADNEEWPFLDKLSVYWDTMNVHLKLLGDLMIYLDRVYCKRTNNVLEVIDLGLEIFRDTTLAPLTDKLNKTMNKVFYNIRDSSTRNDDQCKLLQHIVSMMETIVDSDDNFFLSRFEKEFLSSTNEYYENNINWDNLSPLECFEKTNALIIFEKKLDDAVFNTDTCAKITDVLKSVLIMKKVNDSIQELVETAIMKQDTVFVKRLLDLTQDETYQKNILDAIISTILKDLNAIKLDNSLKKRSQVGTKWITNLLDIFESYEKFLEQIEFGNISFNQDNNGKSDDVGIVKRLLNESFSVFLSENGKQSAQFICYYFDSFIRLGTSDIKNDLHRCKKLLKLISEKDEFASIYKQQLSRRLLQQNSIIEIEKLCVKQIKDEMGSFLTFKFENMLRDVSTSMDLSNSFRTSSSHEVDFQFVPEVLTITAWPFQSENDFDKDIILPSRFEQTKLDFITYYSKKYNQRQLKWAHNLSIVEIGFQFLSSYHDLTMSLYAATIFLLFEEYEELSMETIKELTNIPEQELTRQLLSMAVAPRTRIMKKFPPTKTISSTDIFSINYAFTAPIRNIKVQTIAGVIPASQRTATMEKELLERERSLESNAAIVRIMKSDRKLTHTELFEKAIEVVKTRFTLTTPIFKRSLNYLIEKEYLQRDPDDPSFYHYII